VVQEFFGVLRPAEIDVLERVRGRQAEHQRALVHHLEQEASRLEYAAKRAERQYNCVDPDYAQSPIMLSPGRPGPAIAALSSYLAPSAL